MKIVYVSIGILINESDEILLERNQTNSSFKGLWQFPGGKVKDNETPLSALKRELEEETGVNISLRHTKPVYFMEYDNNEKYYVVLFYICKKWNNEPISKLNQPLQWTQLQDMKNLPFLPYNKSIINKILEEYNTF